MDCPFCYARWFVDNNRDVIYDQPATEFEVGRQWVAIPGIGAEAEHEAEHETEFESELEVGQEREQEAESVAPQEADREAEPQVEQEAGTGSEAEDYSERAPKRCRLTATESGGFSFRAI
jgi:hypothetical protein